MAMAEMMQSVENFTNGTDICGNNNTFLWPDYFILVVMLIISASIGLFYGYFGPKQKTASDFLLGGSSMGTFPMAMSLASR
jgi:sodium-coupled monocarboxylate transporter 8/12